MSDCSLHIHLVVGVVLRASGRIRTRVSPSWTNWEGRVKAHLVVLQVRLVVDSVADEEDACMQSQLSRLSLPRASQVPLVARLDAPLPGAPAAEVVHSPKMA